MFLIELNHFSEIVEFTDMQLLVVFMLFNVLKASRIAFLFLFLFCFLFFFLKSFLGLGLLRHFTPNFHILTIFVSNDLVLSHKLWCVVFYFQSAQRILWFCLIISLPILPSTGYLEICWLWRECVFCSCWVQRAFCKCQFIHDRAFGPSRLLFTKMGSSGPVRIRAQRREGVSWSCRCHWGMHSFCLLMKSVSGSS